MAASPTPDAFHLDEHDPMVVLVDQLESARLEAQLDAVASLATFTAALGEQRTRDEFVPFLTELVNTRPEVVTAVLRALPGLVEHLGGPAHAGCLVPPLLELLDQTPEPSVRDAVIDTLHALLDVTGTDAALLEALRRSTSVAGQLAFCKLAASRYPKAAEAVQRDLEMWLDASLAADDGAVRQAAVVAMAAIADKLPDAAVQQLTTERLQDLTVDPDETVRQAVVPLLIPLARRLSPDQRTEAILPAITNLCSDDEPATRLAFATQLHELSEALGTALAQAEMVPLLELLCRDSVAAIRQKAATQVAALGRIVGPERACEDFLPLLHELAYEASQVPASIYVAQAVELVPAVSGATAKGFLDFLADTLRAESVRPESMRPQQSLQAMNAIADGLGLLVKAVPADVLRRTLVPAIMEQQSEKLMWRLRLRSYETVLEMALQGAPELVADELLPTLLRWVDDPTSAVREEAPPALHRVAVQRGPAWTAATLLPGRRSRDQLCERCPPLSTATYLLITSALNALAAVLPAADADPGVTAAMMVWPAALRHRIPNVRFTAARLAPAVDGCVRGHGRTTAFRELLRELAESDPDDDVREHCVKALRAMPAP